MKFDIPHEIFYLEPLENRDIYFPDIIHNYLAQYSKFLMQRGTRVETIHSVERFSQDVGMCLQEYYCGQHGSARHFFDDAMQHIHVEDAYAPLHTSVFYRARNDKLGKRLTMDEMFHIPFEERYKVATRRFSYPGLPCLYLGSSPEACCAELSDHHDELSVAQFKLVATGEILVLDLTFFESYDFNMLKPNQLEHFLRLWPLVACCSFTYRSTDGMAFRPDYVLPQLLLEHVIDKTCPANMTNGQRRVWGIKYRSVKEPYFEKSVKYDGEPFHNYVFPAISGRRKGHCPDLENLFTVTQVSFLNEL